MNNKLFITSGILILASLFLLLLWKNSILLSILLILLAYLKHKLFPIKKELFWFLIIAIGGAVVEIILVNIGQAWNYATQHFFGIPIWMPLFWGVLGTTIVEVYGAFFGKR